MSAREKVLEYLFIQRHNSVSLRDLVRGTELETTDISKVLDELSSLGIIQRRGQDYKLDFANGNTRECYADYRREIAEGWERVLRSSQLPPLTPLSR